MDINSGWILVHMKPRLMTEKLRVVSSLIAELASHGSGLHRATSYHSQGDDIAHGALDIESSYYNYSGV